jgi:hypothetical protein
MLQLDAALLLLLHEPGEALPMPRFPCSDKPRSRPFVPWSTTQGLEHAFTATIIDSSEKGNS